MASKTKLKKALKGFEHYIHRPSPLPWYNLHGYGKHNCLQPACGASDDAKKKPSAASEGEGEAGVGDNIEAATSEKFAAHGHHQILSVVRMALA